MPEWKDRIVKRDPNYPLSKIKYNPLNFRVHNEYQKAVLGDLIEDVGWIQDVIINVKTGNLVDGELRCRYAELEGQETIGAIFIDVSEEEEKKILASIDPISAMAKRDSDKLNELIDQIGSRGENFDALLKDLYRKKKEFRPVNYLDRSVQLEPEKEYIVILCEDLLEFDKLREILGMGLVRRGGYKPGSQFDDKGKQRVIKAEDVFKKILEWKNDNSHS